MQLLTVLLGLVLVTISTVFAFLPAWATVLPGMNVFHASFGHNHLAAFLLLVLPPSWWFALVQYSQGKKNALILPVIFSVSLLFSFGRVAVWIGLIQLLLIYWFFIRKLLKHTFAHTLLRLLLILFISISLGKVMLSFLPLEQCPFSSLQSRLCKPFAKEHRLEYWQQGLSALTEFPIWGYGPGTFSLINTRYREDSYTATSYAHNAYLQAFAELGVIGGVAYGGLMMGLLGIALKKVSQLSLSKIALSESWPFFLVISLISIYLNVFFDFDWSFFGIYVTTLLYLALLLRLSLKSDLVLPISFLNIHLFSLVVVGTLFFGSVFVVTDFLITKKNEQVAFRIFPYFQPHQTIYLRSQELESNQRTQLHTIYRYHPELYQSWFLEVYKMSPELMTDYYLINPWVSFFSPKLDIYADDNNQKLLDLELEHIKSMLRNYPEQKEHIAFSQIVTIGEYAIKKGNTYLINGNLDEAAKWYLFAHELEPWIFDKKLDGELFMSLNDSQFLTLMASLRTINGRYYGHWQEVIGSRYLTAIKTDSGLLKELARDELHTHSSYIVEIVEWKKNELASLLLDTMYHFLLREKEEVAVSYFEAFQSLKTSSTKEVVTYVVLLNTRAHTMIKIDAPENKIIIPLRVMIQLQPAEYWLAPQLGNYYVLKARDSAEAEKWLNLAKSEFEKCLENFAGEHPDCYYSLQSIQNNYPNYDRYWEVSQIIEATFNVK